LQTGSGNLVRKVENLKKLGAKTAKELPKQMLDD
jgi:DNA recombination protein RmuC